MRSKASPVPPLRLEPRECKRPKAARLPLPIPDPAASLAVVARGKGVGCPLVHGEWRRAQSGTMPMRSLSIGSLRRSGGEKRAVSEATDRLSRFVGTPGSLVLSRIAWAGHQICPLARGAVVLAGIEVGLLLILLIRAGTIPHTV